MPRLTPEQPERQDLFDYMTAADLMGVSPGILLQWLREGELPCERLGVKWYVTSTDIANELGITPADLKQTTNGNSSNC